MEILDPSSSFLPLKKRMRPTLDDPPVVARAKNPGVFSGNTKYKGVVKQHNGTWGAQIYIDRRRIWLGTFRSAAEAAKAYDSASIKLGKDFDADSTVHEREFQEHYTTEAVLDMIKDGSYPHQFEDFLINRSRIATSVNSVGSKQSGEDKASNNCFSCKQLFQKELTLSDVGKLNRLVIPKKYAVKCLPCISHDRREIEEGEIREDADEVEVVLYDRAMRQWKFRYCYWSSSQSYVFTRGWIGFVREKQLKEKDIVVFYTCSVKTLDGTIQNFLMIDVHNFSSGNGFVVPTEVNRTVLERDVEVIKTGNIVSSKSEDKKGGFMLFGVRMQ